MLRRVANAGCIGGVCPVHHVSLVLPVIQAAVVQRLEAECKVEQGECLDAAPLAAGPLSQVQTTTDSRMCLLFTETGRCTDMLFPVCTISTLPAPDRCFMLETILAHGNAACILAVQFENRFPS